MRKIVLQVTEQRRLLQELEALRSQVEQHNRARDQSAVWAVHATEVNEKVGPCACASEGAGGRGRGSGRRQARSGGSGGWPCDGGATRRVRRTSCGRAPSNARGHRHRGTTGPGGGGRVAGAVAGSGVRPLHPPPTRRYRTARTRRALVA